jgi:hypothetical protein
MGVEHIEFATKFYLLQGEHGARRHRAELRHLRRPQPGRQPGRKMRKIFDRQLSLGSASGGAGRCCRGRWRGAQALVKGWLFYPAGEGWPAMSGIAAGHCRGFWCALSELEAMAPTAS